MINILTDLLPTEFAFDDYTIKINSNFRTLINIEILFNNTKIEQNEKWEKAFNLFYKNIPFKLDEDKFIILAEYLIDFYRCGRAISEVSNSTGNTKSKINRIYCFKFDAEYIYSAFKHDYNIDLQKENLHWWEFNSLFKSLSEENEFIKIMQYRSMEINNDMTQKEKNFYKKMKEKYKIPEEKIDVDLEHKDALEEALLKGESIGHLI